MTINEPQKKNARHSQFVFAARPAAAAAAILTSEIDKPDENIRKQNENVYTLCVHIRRQEWKKRGFDKDQINDVNRN